MTLVSARTIGLVLVVGFVMLVVGAFVAPSGAYEGPVADRLAIIDANKGQWQLSKVFDALSVVLASVGMVLFSLLNHRGVGGLLNSLGGVCLAAAGVVGLIWVYRLVTEPGPLYDRDTPAPLVTIFVALTALGILAFGLHLLRARYPKWLGVFNAMAGGGVLLALIVILVSRAGPETAFGLASLLYVAVLAIGVVLLRDSSRRPAPVSPKTAH